MAYLTSLWDGDPMLGDKKRWQLPFSVLFFLLLEEESDAGDSDLSLRKLRSPLCADAQTLDAAADPRATVLPSKLGLEPQKQSIMFFYLNIMCNLPHSK